MPYADPSIVALKRLEAVRQALHGLAAEVSVAHTALVSAEHDKARSILCAQAREAVFRHVEKLDRDFIASRTPNAEGKRLMLPWDPSKVLFDRADEAREHAAAAFSGEPPVQIPGPGFVVGGGAPSKNPAPLYLSHRFTYTVKDGDTLSHIARITGCHPRGPDASGTYYNGALLIAKVNRISNPHHIEPGWELIIPPWSES